MASIAISASMQSACSSHHVINRQSLAAPVGRLVRTFVANQATHVVSPKIEGKKGLNIAEGQLNKQTVPPLGKLMEAEDKKMQSDDETDNSVHVKFFDERWKNGTWDLNMFVKAGKMDWDGVIVAEAKRRKFLQLNPEESTNQEPVLFRTSIIPWWAWITHSHLPEAELLNGRAAMVGFFMGYVVDALTGMNVVGQTGNFICKAGLFSTVLGVILFRRTEDFKNLKSVADEATFYDKQWQASWPQDQDSK